MVHGGLGWFKVVSIDVAELWLEAASPTPDWVPFLQDVAEFPD